METWSRFVKCHQMSSSVINLSMKRYDKFLQDPAMQRSLFEALVFEDTMESLAAKEAELTKEVPQLLETMFLAFSKILVFIFETCVFFSFSFVYFCLFLIISVYWCLEL